MPQNTKFIYNNCKINYTEFEYLFITIYLNNTKKELAFMNVKINKSLTLIKQLKILAKVAFINLIIYLPNFLKGTSTGSKISHFILLFYTIFSVLHIIRILKGLWYSIISNNFCSVRKNGYKVIEN